MKNIIIPDLHGDVEELYNILKSFNIINIFFEDFIYLLFFQKEFFINVIKLKDINLIFLGDILDSKVRNETDINLVKYSDLFVFYAANRLKEMYPNNVVLILGNHELMNFYKIFDYVNEYSSRTPNIIKYIRNKISKNFVITHKIDKMYFAHADVITEKDDKEILYFIKTTKNYDYSRREEQLYDFLFNQRINMPIKNKSEHDKYHYIFFGHSIVDKIKKITNRFYVDQGISKCFLMTNSCYEIPYIENNEIKFLTIKRLNNDPNYISNFLKKFNFILENIN